jgi:hypothetical protein
MGNKFIKYSVVILGLGVISALSFFTLQRFLEMKKDVKVVSLDEANEIIDNM